MPQRFLRPGITNSTRWNCVPFDSQSLFIRLLTLVDDYGRFDGRYSVIWGHCFSIWNEHNPDKFVDLQQVTRMLQQLAAQKLIEIYDESEKRVLQITQWQERIRQNVKEKWPARAKVAAMCSELLPSSPSSTPSPIDIGVPTPEIIYQSYPRKVAKPKALSAIRTAMRICDPETLLNKTAAYARVVQGDDPQFIPYPATWFNQQRFNDDPSTWRRTFNSKNGSSVKVDRDVPDDFKSWAASEYPAKRSAIMNWKKISQVNQALWQEWCREKKKRQPVQ